MSCRFLPPIDDAVLTYLFRHEIVDADPSLIIHRRYAAKAAAMQAPAVTALWKTMERVEILILRVWMYQMMIRRKSSSLWLLYQGLRAIRKDIEEMLTKHEGQLEPYFIQTTEFHILWAKIPMDPSEPTLRPMKLVFMISKREDWMPGLERKSSPIG